MNFPRRLLSVPPTQLSIGKSELASRRHPGTFANVNEKWVPEIKHHCPGVPFLLVGTQADLREDPGRLEQLSSENAAPTTVERGQQLARELGAVKYVECSALTGRGLKRVFDEAILAAVMDQRQGKNKKRKKKSTKEANNRCRVM